MTIYLIGALITLGFLTELDEGRESKKTSFWGMLFIRLIWPFFWGMITYKAIEE